MYTTVLVLVLIVIFVLPYSYISIAQDARVLPVVVLV